MAISDIWAGLTGKPAATPAATTVTPPAGDTSVQPGGEAKPAEPAPLSNALSWFTPSEKDAKPEVFDPTKLIDHSPEAQQEFQRAVGGLNFMDGVATPEVMEKIQAGGPEAVQATVAMMNKMAQGVFQAATQAAVKINETTLAKASPHIDSKIANILRESKVESAIRDASPVLAHPSSKFMVESLKTSFQAKYPTATPAEITQLAKQYITDIIAVGTPKPDNKTDVMATDWAKFME
jgi:hypothetical protein